MLNILQVEKKKKEAKEREKISRESENNKTNCKRKKLVLLHTPNPRDLFTLLWHDGKIKKKKGTASAKN